MIQFKSMKKLVYVVIVGLVVTTRLYAQTCNPTASDPNRNWNYSVYYDENGNKVGEVKSFSDEMGRPIQTNVMNLETGSSMVSEVKYDVFGRGTVQTLPAPSYTNCVNYKTGFMKNGNGDIYDYTDFDDPNATSRDAAGAINNPNGVNQSTKGTLGWYYSTNNDEEPMTAASLYPFTQVEYYNGTGRVKRVSGAGGEHRFGSGHAQEFAQMPILNEMDHYLSLRDHYVNRWS